MSVRNVKGGGRRESGSKNCIARYRRAYLCGLNLIVKEFSFFVSNLLPLGVKIIIYFSISDGHHDNQDPEKNHADQELVHHPHRNDCSLQVFGSLTPRNDALG